MTKQSVSKCSRPLQWLKNKDNSTRKATSPFLCLDKLQLDGKKLFLFLVMDYVATTSFYWGIHLEPRPLFISLGVNQSISQSVSQPVSGVWELLCWLMEWWDWWDRRTCYSLNILIWAAFTTDGASNHWHCVRHILPPTGIICAPNWKSASLAGGGAFATVSPYLYFCLNSISMQAKSS